MNKKVGAKIKSLRNKNGDSLKALGAKIDFDWSNLSKLERGQRTATVDILTKIANVYHVDMVYFFDGGLTDAERNLFNEETWDLSEIRSKYDFVSRNGTSVSDKEILAAIEIIRLLKQKI